MWWQLAVIEWDWVGCEELCRLSRMLSIEAEGQGDNFLQDLHNSSHLTRAEFSDKYWSIHCSRHLIAACVLHLWWFLCIRDAGRRGNKITAYVGVFSPTLVMLQTHLEMVFWWKPLLMHAIKYYYCNFVLPLVWSSWASKTTAYLMLV